MGGTGRPMSGTDRPAKKSVRFHEKYLNLTNLSFRGEISQGMDQSSLETKRLEKWYVDTIEKLKSNFNALRSEYIKYKKYHQEQKQKWYKEITNKRNEIEEMGVLFDRETETIKNLKLELFEEKEMKERLKIDLQSSDKYRVMYTESQEEIDRLKYQLEQVNDEHQRNLDKVRQDYEERLEELEDEQKTHLSSSQNFQQLQEQVKSLTFQLSASNARQEEQVKEIENLRSEKLQEFRNSEQKTQHLTSRIQNLSQSQRQMQLQLSKTTIREKQLEIQLKEVTSESEKLQRSNLTLTKKASELQHLISENDHSFTLHKKEVHMEHTKIIRQKEIEIERLQGKLRLIERDHESLQHQVEEMERQSKLMDEKYERKYQSLMQNEFSQLSNLKQEKADLELQLGEAERLSSQQSKVWAMEKERHRRSIEELKTQVSDQEDESSRQLESMEHLQGIIMKMKQDRMSVEEELDSWKKKESTHEMEKDKLRDDHSKTLQKVKKLKVSLEYKEREQLDLLNKLEEWRKKNQGQAHEEDLGLTKLRQAEKRKNQYKASLLNVKKKSKKKIRQFQTILSQKTRHYEHLIQEYKKKEEVNYEQMNSLRKTIFRMKRENERIYQLQGMMGGGTSDFAEIPNQFNSRNNVSFQGNTSYGTQNSFVGADSNNAGENNISMNHLMKDIKNLNHEVNNFLMI